MKSHITILASVIALSLFVQTTAGQMIIIQSPTDDSYVTFAWTKNDPSMIFQMNYETKDVFEDGQEVRLCFESLKVGDDYNTDTKSVVFYGDVKEGRFTHVGIPNTELTQLNHEFWVCSRPRDSEYIQLIGLDNAEFDVMHPNVINKTTNQAAIQFQMPLDRFDIGNNLVQIAWGLFPDKDSSQMDLVRGTGEPLTFYNEFKFNDLYDNDLNFWGGFAIFILSQFWGLAFPLAALVQMAYSVYDFVILAQSILLMLGVTDEHPSKDEFTIINLIQDPIRRLVVNEIVLSLMVQLAVFQFIAVILSLVSTFSGQSISFINAYQFNSEGWWTMMAVTYVVIPTVCLIYDGIMLFAFYMNITV